MNKCTLPLLIILFSATVNFTFCQPFKFSIVGNVPSLKNEMVRLSVYDVNTTQYTLLDSVMAKQGKFEILGQITEPKLYVLFLGDYSEQLVIGNENIKI